MQSDRLCKWIYVLLLFLHLSATAQPNSLAGSRYTYKSKYGNPVESYISIGDSTLEFYHFWGCCLMVRYFGRGSYYVYKDTIFMCTDIEVPDKLTTYEIEGSLERTDQVHLRFREYPGYQHSFCAGLLDERGKSIGGACTQEERDYITLDSLPPVGSGNYTVKIDDYNDDLLVPLEKIRGKSIIVSMAGMHILRGEDLFFVLSDNGQRITGPCYLPVRWSKRMRRKAVWRHTLYALRLKKRPMPHNIHVTPMIRQQ